MPGPDEGDAGQTADAGAAQKPHQNRLHLVVRLVRQRQLVGAHLLRRLPEGGIAEAAGHILQVPPLFPEPGGDVHPMDFAGDAPFPAPGLHVGLIRLARLPPQLMVHVNGEDPPILLGGQTPQGVQEGHGIRPSRHAHQHRVPLFQ